MVIDAVQSLRYPQELIRMEKTARFGPTHSLGMNRNSPISRCRPKEGEKEIEFFRNCKKKIFFETGNFFIEVTYVWVHDIHQPPTTPLGGWRLAWKSRGLFASFRVFFVISCLFMSFRVIFMFVYVIFMSSAL